MKKLLYNKLVFPSTNYGTQCVHSSSTVSAPKCLCVWSTRLHFPPSRDKAQQHPKEKKTWSKPR